MRLYFTPLAPNPERVRFFLQEKGVWNDLQKTEVSIIKQEHKTPDYLALSPLNQVPALELDDGTALTESRAICTYFEGVFPEPNLMGRDAKERALIEMWDRRVELTYLFNIAGWFRNSHPAMAELEKPQCREWAEICFGRAKERIAFFDQRLAEAPFVASDRFSIADITLHVALGFGRVMKFKPWEELKNLASWRERMLARPGLAG